LLFYFFRPSGYFALMGLFAFAAIASPANALSTFSVLPDTVEYGEWKTGKRVEAGLFSAMILAQKFAIGLGSWLAGFALSRSGYSPSAGIPAEGVDSFLQVMFLGPAIASIITIAILTRYPITPALHARLVRAIAWRNRHRNVAP
jgi:GPH family glycoside/pentoside/hexuronide:cation symporter